MSENTNAQMMGRQLIKTQVELQTHGRQRVDDLENDAIEEFVIDAITSILHYAAAAGAGKFWSRVNRGDPSTAAACGQASW